MAENPEPNGPVANPTYMADIRNFFTSDDVTHMGAKGYDLATYDGVKSNASDIYDQTEAGNMPPGQAWSADRVQTFSNWMTSGYPLVFLNYACGASVADERRHDDPVAQESGQTQR